MTRHAKAKARPAASQPRSPSTARPDLEARVTALEEKVQAVYEALRRAAAEPAVVARVAVGRVG